MVQKRDPRNREILFEFQQVGASNSVRVSAIDPLTNTEVVIVGDKRLSEKRLMDTAMRKLNYVLEKNLEKNKQTR